MTQENASQGMFLVYETKNLDAAQIGLRFNRMERHILLSVKLKWF